MKPCPQCPFLQNSDYQYDSDAMQALDNGDEPACHMHVGSNLIFAHVSLNPPVPCAGYLSWIEEKPGFTKPKGQQP